MGNLRRAFITIFAAVVVIIALTALFQRSPTPNLVEPNRLPPVKLPANKLDHNMKLTSNAFAHNNPIPAKYTCDGDNINPQLLFSDVPDKTQSLVLLMDDPDIPDFVKEQRGIEKFDHWTVFNMPADIVEISENSSPSGVQGANSSGNSAYTGPCPPDREHRYFFKLFALDTRLELSEGATQQEVAEAMDGHILEQAELVGLYERQ